MHSKNVFKSVQDRYQEDSPVIRNLLFKRPSEQVFEDLEKKLAQFKDNGTNYVIIFQPGAGAPVNDIMSNWLDAGLAGCTNEICTISKDFKDVQWIIINSMSAEEQKSANQNILNNKGIDISQLHIVNDEFLILSKLLRMTDEETVEVSGRFAYTPQALICGYNGKILNRLTPTVEQNKARDADNYLDSIKSSLKHVAVHVRDSIFNKRPKLDKVYSKLNQEITTQNFTPGN